MHPIHRQGVLTASLLVAIAVFGAGFALNEGHRHLVLTTDSIVYLDTARHIAAGDGVRTSILHLDQVELTPPQTQYPPLTSMVIAPLLAVGVDLIDAGRLVNAFAFGLVVILVGLWLWRLDGPLTGLAGAASLLTLGALTSTAAAVWSDLLYTVIVTRIVWLGPGLLRRPTDHGWFRIGALIGIAILTKFLGLTLLGLLGALHLFDLMRPRSLTARLRHLGASILGVGIFTVPLLLRNVILDRSIGGVQRFASAQPLPDIVADAWSTLRHDFTASGLWTGLVALAAVSVVMIALRRQRIPRVRLYFRTRLLIPGALAVVFLLGLVAARWTIDTDTIYTRFTVPIYPTIVVLILTVIASVSRMFGQPVRATFMIILIGLSLGWTIKAYDFGREPYRPIPATRAAWVLAHTTPNDLIVGDHAPEYLLFARRNVMRISGNAAAPRLTPDDLDRLRSRWTGMVERVLFVLTPNLDPVEYGDFAAQLSRKAMIDDRLTLVHDGEKILVYQLRSDES